MAIQSTVDRGRIYAGETPLALTITVEQTGPMQVTVRAGSFTSTGQRRKDRSGNWLPWIEEPVTYALAADQTVDLTADLLVAKEYVVELGVNGLGAVDVLVRSRIVPDPFPPPPPGWTTIHMLVFPFRVPPLTLDLTDVDIYALTIRPGFPDGTTAANWQTQTGGTS